MMAGSQTVQSKIEKYKASSTSLVYPAGLSRGIIFDFRKYRFPQFNQDLQSIARTSTEGTNSSITLPLPGLNEKTNIGNKDSQLGLLGAAVSTLASRDADIEALGTSASQGVKSLFSNALSGDDSGAGGFVMKQAARYAGSTLGGAGFEAGVDVATGTSQNNFTTLAFDDVQLREYTFNWLLLPDKPSDVDLFNRIKKRLHVYSLPTYTLDGTFNDGLLSRVLFNYPYIVEAQLFGLDQNSFFEFKPAMITGISANYVNEGRTPIMRDGKPAMMELSVTMKEVAIWTAEDYLGE